VVTADRKGVVNILSFTWSFFSYSCNVECVADGSSGQVLALTTLLPVAESSDTVPLMQSLVAVSTLAGTMVYSVHPVPKVVFKIIPPESTPGGDIITYLSFLNPKPNPEPDPNPNSNPNLEAPSPTCPSVDQVSGINRTTTLRETDYSLRCWRSLGGRRSNYGNWCHQSVKERIVVLS